MYPPEEDWDWTSGTIKHVDLEQQLRDHLPDMVDAFQGVGGVNSDYFDEDDDPTEGWEEYAFVWLTKTQDAKFHLPGSRVGKRSKICHYFSGFAAPHCSAQFPRTPKNFMHMSNVCAKVIIQLFIVLLISNPCDRKSRCPCKDSFLVKSQANSCSKGAHNCRYPGAS
jgi:hypothetical protein